MDMLAFCRSVRRGTSVGRRRVDRKKNALCRTQQLPKSAFARRRLRPRQVKGSYRIDLASRPLRGGSDNNTDKTTLLLDRYDVSRTKTLGRGGFAVVYQVSDIRSKRDVALKQQLKGGMGDFVREINVMTHLKPDLDRENNTNIVQFYGHFVITTGSEQRCCLVLELLSTSLFRAIHVAPRFPLRITRILALQICSALSFLRRVHVVHGDLKPANIMLRKDGRTAIKLGDFGLSHVVGVHCPPDAVQTTFYRAPEVVLSSSRLYPIDMWSFGCLLVEMHIRDVLFVAKSNGQLLLHFATLLGLPSPALLAEWGNVGQFLVRGNGGDYRIPVHAIHLEKPRPSLEDLIVTKQYHYRDTDATQKRQLLELVLDILVYAADTRITPDQALQYDFFTKHDCSNVDVEFSPSKERR